MFQSDMAPSLQVDVPQASPFPPQRYRIQSSPDHSLNTVRHLSMRFHLPRFMRRSRTQPYLRQVQTPGNGEQLTHSTAGTSVLNPCPSIAPIPATASTRYLPHYESPQSHLLNRSTNRPSPQLLRRTSSSCRNLRALHSEQEYFVEPAKSAVLLPSPLFTESPADCISESSSTKSASWENDVSRSQQSGSPPAECGQGVVSGYQNDCRTPSDSQESLNESETTPQSMIITLIAPPNRRRDVGIVDARWSNSPSPCTLRGSRSLSRSSEANWLAGTLSEREVWARSLAVSINESLTPSPECVTVNDEDQTHQIVS